MNKSLTQVLKKETAAIILAGGTARRLADKRPPGGKAECIIGGQSLLSIVSGALVPVARLILVVGGELPKVSSQELVPIRHIPDHQPGSGPLAAVRDGLRWIWHEHSRSLPQFVILSACDLPSIKSSLVSEMVDRFPQDELSTRWVIPEVGKRLQYLFSVCRPTILQPLDSFLRLVVVTFVVLFNIFRSMNQRVFTSYQMPSGGQLIQMLMPAVTLILQLISPFTPVTLHIDSRDALYSCQRV